MHKKNNYIPAYILILLFTTALLTGCTQTLATKKQMRAFEDDSIITASGDTYSCLTRLTNDNNYTVKDFTGCMTMWDMKLTSEETYTFTYDLDVTKGKAKIVLIAPDDTVTILSEQDNELSILLSQGLYRVKFVGQHASAKASIQAERNKK